MHMQCLYCSAKRNILKNDPSVKLSDAERRVQVPANRNLWEDVTGRSETIPGSLSGLSKELIKNLTSAQYLWAS